MSTKRFSFPCFVKIFLKAKAVFHDIFCRVDAHIAVMPRLVGYSGYVLLVFWVPQNKSVLGAVLNASSKFAPRRKAGRGTVLLFCFVKIFLKAKAVFHNIFCRVGAHIAVMPRLIGYSRNVLLVFWVPQNKSVLGTVLIHPLERIEFFIVMLKVGIIFPVIG